MLLKLNPRFKVSEMILVFLTKQLAISIYKKELIRKNKEELAKRN